MTINVTQQELREIGAPAGHPKSAWNSVKRNENAGLSDDGKAERKDARKAFGKRMAARPRIVRKDADGKKVKSREIPTRGYFIRVPVTGFQRIRIQASDRLGKVLGRPLFINVAQYETACRERKIYPVLIGVADDKYLVNTGSGNETVTPTVFWLAPSEWRRFRDALVEYLEVHRAKTQKARAVVATRKREPEPLPPKVEAAKQRENRYAQNLNDVAGSKFRSFADLAAAVKP